MKEEGEPIFLKNTAGALTFRNEGDTTDLDLPSNPVFTTANDVTGSRAHNTVYQNTSGKTMFVVASLHDTSGRVIEAFSDSAATPTTKVAKGNLVANVGGILPFMVLNNHYYYVKATAGTPTISVWMEWY